MGVVIVCMYYFGCFVYVMQIQELTIELDSYQNALCISNLSQRDDLFYYAKNSAFT